MGSLSRLYHILAYLSRAAVKKYLPGMEKCVKPYRRSCSGHAGGPVVIYFDIPIPYGRSLSSVMRRLTFLCLAALLLLSLSACGPAVPFGGDGSELSYADGAFSASVRGTVCRTSPDGYAGDPALVGEGRTGVPWELAALVSVTSPGGDGSRTITVTYTEPASLAGLVVTRSVTPAVDADAAPVVTDTLTLDGISVTDAAGLYEGLLLPALALLPDGDVTDISRDADGRRTVTVTGASTTVYEYAYTFLRDTPLPVRVAVKEDGRTAEFTVSAR